MNPRRESRHESYDVVVVGSGIGGLSAAALLARAGRSVLVVERHDRAGGYAHGFQRRRYRFDSAVHATSGCEPVGFGSGDLIDQTLRALGVRDAVTFVPTDNFYTAMFPGLRIDAPVGLEPFLAAHLKYFPDAEPGLRKLLRLCTRINREAKKVPAGATAADLLARSAEFPLHTRYRDASVSDVLDQYLTDARLKTVLTAQWAYQGVPPSRLAFSRWSAMMLSYIHTGAYHAVGGFQTLVDAFGSALIKHGGELLLRTNVRRILVEDSRAIGVQLENGQRITADQVISNVDATMTVEELVGSQHFPAEYLQVLRNMRPSLSAVSSYFATDVDMTDVPGATHETFVFDSWDHDASYASMVEGHAVPFVVTIPTLLDPSLAPPGEHLLIVCSLVSYEHASWRSAKDDILVQQQRQLIAMYPQLEGRFTFAEAATPRTMERYTLNSSGAIYGWEATPDQSGFDRLPRQTPIAGLSLAGHWTQPGSGVMSVLVSGAQTAQLLLGLPDVNSLFASLPEPVSVA